MVAKLQRVPLRKVWPDEAADFTPWLQDNLDALNDAAGLDLSNPAREQTTENFRVDLIAKDAEGNPVVIENQLEASDHDHLGKLITYMAARGAKKAIWITKDPQQEHVQAVSWLNEFSPADFYLIKVEAVQIENSPPAALFTVIVGPSQGIRQIGREIGREKSESAGAASLGQQFLTELREKAKTRTELFANAFIAGSRLRMGAGKPGRMFDFCIEDHKVAVQLEVDTNRGEQNREFFQGLLASRQMIEAAFAEALSWGHPESQKPCVCKWIKVGGYRDEEKWGEIQDAMIESMVKLIEALRPYIEALS